jgi:HPt (histidine-containing phosphotransfer) domain-containing protein
MPLTATRSTSNTTCGSRCDVPDHRTHPTKLSELFDLTHGSSPLTDNHHELMTQIGDDLELVTEIVELFLEESPLLLADLRQAIADRDAKAVERAAHRLKHSSGQFGSNPVVVAAVRLEVLGRKGDLADIDSTFRTLQQELQELRTRLSDWSRTVALA